MFIETPAAIFVYCQANLRLSEICLVGGGGGGGGGCRPTGRQVELILRPDTLQYHTFKMLIMSSGGWCMWYPGKEHKFIYIVISISYFYVNSLIVD